MRDDTTTPPACGHPSEDPMSERTECSSDCMYCLGEVCWTHGAGSCECDASARHKPAAVSAPAGEATKPLLAAPCVFCGYNGEGYWQRGTHETFCPWRDVGGEGERRERLREIMAARSPAPASGAPGEEDGNREVKMLLVENVNLRTRLAAAESLSKLTSTETTRACDEVLALRSENAVLTGEIGRLGEALAAAERAGVALREALLGDDPTMPPALQPLSTIETAIALACDMEIQDHGESDEDYESVWSALMDARQACKTLRAALTPTAPSPDAAPKED